jgi:glycosyltransferase involved in cell wall biosynthesis
MPHRILVLNERDPHNPLAGGAELHIFEIFSRLAARGHEVTLLAASFEGGAREEVVQGVRVLRLTNRYLYYAAAPWVARRMARAGEVDVVVDTLNKLPFLSPWFVPVPCFTIVHHLFGTTAFNQVSFPIALVTWASEKLIPAAYRRTTMLAISPSTRDDLVERGLPGAKIAVVPPGVDLDLYREAPAGGGRPRSVAWVGRLEPYKRADTVIDAMAVVRRSVPDARLVIVGAGSARADLEQRVARQGLAEAVEFTGFVSEARKVEILQEAAVLTQTSEKEGWGMTVIEGNACGTPAVATRVPGLRDAVRDAVSGLLVPYGDVDALARAIVKIFESEELRASLVEGGRQWARRFSWDRVADDCETLIEAALRNDAGLPPLVASLED